MDGSPRLWVRVDATPEIGAGHFMRCFALAERWIAEGGGATFVGRFPAGLAARLADAGIDLVPVPASHPDPGDLEATLRAIPPGATVVLDGYGFDPEYQRRLRAENRRLMVVDDTGHLPAYEADLLLNQNADAGQVVYRDAPAARLLGSRYVMLRQEFLGWRERPREVPAVARNLLVTLGGGDALEQTLEVLEELAATPLEGATIRVLPGPANRRAAELIRWCARRGRPFEVLADPPDLPALMAGSDLAVSAAGGTCWEMAFLGLPAALIVLADNQEPIARAMEARGAAMRWTGAPSLARLAADPLRRRKMGENGRGMIDGLGAARVVAALKELAS